MYLLLAGLAGVVIDGIILPLGARIVFPPLLSSWDELGPMGVAMALLTWCGAIGTGWVVTAWLAPFSGNAPPRPTRSSEAQTDEVAPEPA